MSATVNENLNPFLNKDRVAVKDKSSFLHNKKGSVVRTFDTSVEVKLDNKMTVIIYFKKLKKLRIK